MATVKELFSSHPLLGRWRPDDEDLSAEYEIGVAPSGLSVLGIDSDSGEHFVISNVSWTANAIDFDTLMPSTGRNGRMRILDSNGRATMTFTFIDRCEVKRIDNLNI